jgi:hypothetical protein
MDWLTMILGWGLSFNNSERPTLKVITNLGMFLHGLLDHNPGVEDLLQQL